MASVPDMVTARSSRVSLRRPYRYDFDHADGDRSNNDISNAQALCKNCHGFKTYVEQQRR